MFLGFFTEFSKTKNIASGDFIEGNEKQFLRNSANLLSPGTLIGWSNGTIKKWILEFYTGGKYKFEKETTEYLLNQERIFEKSKNQKFGIRIGLNVGFRF